MPGQRIRITGLVQGVGFRPNVWRLAQAHGLAGTVRNDGSGVSIEAWGSDSALAAFLQQLRDDVPPLARIDSIHAEPLVATCPHTDFHILASQTGDIHTGVVPDAALCAACRADIFDPQNRRYRYPFTNCTHCGPRFSMVCGIPYDRANTSMAGFALCPACQREYEDPADRRFHAQPNACAVCGPHLWLETADGQPIPPLASERDPIDTANRLLRAGQILALMGLGGVHLVCDAHNATAVAALRQRKQRYQKPLALMARDSAVVAQYGVLGPAETAALHSKHAPIVLLAQRSPPRLPAAIAPQQRTLGFMLPYTPLHALLLEAWDTPLVMTSANLSEEPQCLGVAETRQRMQGIADSFLLHNRPIINRVDDSVVHIVAKQPRLLRRARGYAPASILLPAGFATSPALVALGGELKSTFALLQDGQALLSAHLGDLEDARTAREYRHTLALYHQLFDHQPQAIVVDQHPGYRSTQLGRQWAQERQIPLIEVQHHHAHVAACLAENGWPRDGGSVLGIVLDGLGYGADGTFWGGEFLLADYAAYQRVGHFTPVAMPGGTQAILQPWRNLWAQLHRLGWEPIAPAFADLELMQFLQQQPLAALTTMLARALNSPLTSSCGRLFDAVAAALGCHREHIQYEGQAAITLEALTPPELLATVTPYPFELKLINAIWQLDPAPMWWALLHDLQRGDSPGIISARFHQGLIVALAQLGTLLCAQHPHVRAVALSGGVFQNRLIFSGLLTRLQQAGIQVLTHSQVPTNDGGLALGQSVIGATRTETLQP